MSHQRLLDRINRIYSNTIDDSIYPDLYSHGYSRLPSLGLNETRQWNIWHKVASDDTMDHGTKTESLCAVLYEIDPETNKFNRRTAVLYQQPEIIDQDFIDSFREDLKALADAVIYNPQTEVALSDDRSPFVPERKPRGYLWFLIGLTAALAEGAVVWLDASSEAGIIPYSSGIVWTALGVLPFASGLGAAAASRIRSARLAAAVHKRYRRDYAAVLEKRNIAILGGNGYSLGADVVKELNTRKEQELAEQQRRIEEQEARIREKELIDAENDLDHREKMRVFEEMEFQMKLDDAEVRSLHLQVSTLIECTNLLKIMKESPELYEEARERFGLEHMQKLIEYAVGTDMPVPEDSADSEEPAESESREAELNVQKKAGEKTVR